MKIPFRFWRKVLQMGRIVWEQTQQNAFFTHVAALTYTSVLSVVPLLALILALGRGFGLEKYIEIRLREQLNVQDNVIDRLMEFANSYIARAQDDVIIGVSFLVLAFTLISLVNSIELRFNALWDVKTSRNLFTFSLSYLGLIVFLVFSIIFLSGVWVYVLKLLDYLPGYDLLQATMPLLIFGLKWFTSAMLFILMFKFIPNTAVHWRSTYIPGVLCGFLFCLVQQFYISGQMFLSSYNVVYGSFAVLPLLMVWIYATWTICLAGVQLCRIIQDWDDLRETSLCPLPCRHDRDVIALELMRRIARRFVEGAPPLRSFALAKACGISRTMAERELRRLVESGMVLEHRPDAEECPFFKVDTDVHQLSVGELFERLDRLGGNYAFDGEASGDTDWEMLSALRESCTRSAEMTVLVKDL